MLFGILHRILFFWYSALTQNKLAKVTTILPLWTHLYFTCVTFLIAAMKYPTKTVSEGRVYFGSWCEGIMHHGGKTWQLDPEGTGDIGSAVRKQRETNASVQLILFLFIHSESWLKGWCCSHSCGSFLLSYHSGESLTDIPRGVSPRGCKSCQANWQVNLYNRLHICNLVSSFQCLHSLFIYLFLLSSVLTFYIDLFIFV